MRVCVCVSVSQYMFESQPVSDPMSGVEGLGFRGQAHARPGKWKGRSDRRQKYFIYQLTNKRLTTSRRLTAMTAQPPLLHAEFYSFFSYNMMCLLPNRKHV